MFLLAVYSNKSKFPSNQLKAPHFPEFEQLFWVEFKLRQQRLKEDKKLFVSEARNHQPDSEFHFFQLMGLQAVVLTKVDFAESGVAF